MSIISIRVEGVESTLRELKRTDTAIYNESIKTIKSTMERAANLARAKYPPQPLSGWVRSTSISRNPPAEFPIYNANRARAGIQPLVMKKSSKSRSSFKVAALRQSDPAGVIFDMAGSRSSGKGEKGAHFISTLVSRTGRASRAMWPAVRANQPAIIAAIDEASKKAATYLNAALSSKKVF